MHGTASTDSRQMGTIGHDLGRHRLEYRTRRLRLVIAALRKRAGASSRSGPIPPGLEHGLTQFSAELSRVRGRLHAECTDDRTARGKTARKRLDDQTRVHLRSVSGRR
jgi:hypothetical protein